MAKVQIGFTPRLGIAGRDDKTDVIFGIVLMQKLERTMDVVTRVRAAVDKMNTDGSLPRGVKIETFYDRGDLVAITVRTVLHNMLFGIALIFLIQWVFLGNLRCALIVAATIPVALLLAVIITVLRGESANLLSVGAIDLGIIVDSTVIMMENIFRHLSHRPRREPVGAGARLSEKLHRVLTSAVEVDKAIFFSVIITIAAFLPLFTMQGVEGQIFGPMSRTYAYALLGAVIATFTVTPVLSSVLLPEHVNEIETFFVRFLRRIYESILPLAVRHYRLAATVALVFLVLCGSLGMRLGTEFLPKLEEGNLWIRALLPPTITLEAGMDSVSRMRDIIRSYAPVQHGRLRAGPRRRGHRSGRLLRRRILRAAETVRRVAQRPDQAGNGQADERAAQSRIRRRRLQFLAIHPGQHRGGGVRRERRELGEDLWARPRAIGAPVENREGGNFGGARRHRSGGLQPVGPAESGHSRSTAPRPRATASPSATSMRWCRRRSAARRSRGSTKAR